MPLKQQSGTETARSCDGKSCGKGLSIGSFPVSVFTDQNDIVFAVFKKKLLVRKLKIMCGEIGSEALPFGVRREYIALYRRPKSRSRPSAFRKAACQNVLHELSAHPRNQHTVRFPGFQGGKAIGLSQGNSFGESQRSEIRGSARQRPCTDIKRYGIWDATAL